MTTHQTSNLLVIALEVLVPLGLTALFMWPILASGREARRFLKEMSK